jgi:hypothetical protein
VFLFIFRYYTNSQHKVEISDFVHSISTLFRIIEKYKEKNFELCLKAFKVLKELPFIKDSFLPDVFKKLVDYVGFFLNSNEILAAVMQCLHMFVDKNVKFWHKENLLEKKLMKLLFLAVEVTRQPVIQYLRFKRQPQGKKASSC